MGEINITDLEFSYQRGGPPVVSRISLGIAHGEFVAIVGPNGCGKTTFLRLLSGLLLPSAGTVAIDGRPPTEATIGFIVQNFAESLFPWATVRENVLFPFSLKVRATQAGYGGHRLEEQIARLGIKLPLEKYPYEISGGQQQLTAIVRSLLYEPDVLLLDEPFSGLDVTTRRRMQDTLLALREHTPLTAVFVTHDIDEALYMADRIIMFTPLPARLAGSTAVPFARPRDRSIVRTMEFSLMRTEVDSRVFPE